MQKHNSWIWFADQDLKAARKLIKDNDVILVPAAYHCQQCLEKILKAYLAFRKQPVIKTHDLIRLVNLCTKFDSDFTKLLELAVDLNPFVTQARYPDAISFMPDLTTIKIIVNQTEEAFNFTKDKIPN